MLSLPRGPGCLAALFLLIAVAACAPALDWREVRPESTSLIAMFPCKPSRQTRELPLAGARVRMELLACEAGGATWALSHAELGDATRVGASLAALNESLAANLGASLSLSVEPWAVPGMTPQSGARRVHLSGTRADGVGVQVEAGVFAHGTRVFQAVAMRPAKEPAFDAETLQGFFGGMRFRS